MHTVVLCPIKRQSLLHHLLRFNISTPFLPDDILDWYKELQSLCFTHTGHTVCDVLLVIQFDSAEDWLFTLQFFFQKPRHHLEKTKQNYEEAEWQRYNLRQAVTADSTCTHDSTHNNISCNCKYESDENWIPVPVTGECEQHNPWAATAIFIALYTSLLAFFMQVKPWGSPNTFFPHLYMYTAIHVVCNSDLGDSDLGDFHNGVCHVFKITTGESKLDMGLLSQQILCFSPKILARDNNPHNFTFNPLMPSKLC